MAQVIACLGQERELHHGVGYALILIAIMNYTECVHAREVADVLPIQYLITGSLVFTASRQGQAKNTLTHL